MSIFHSTRRQSGAHLAIYSFFHSLIHTNPFQIHINIHIPIYTYIQEQPSVEKFSPSIVYIHTQLRNSFHSLIYIIYSFFTSVTVLQSPLYIMHPTRKYSHNNIVESKSLVSVQAHSFEEKKKKNVLSEKIKKKTKKYRLKQKVKMINVL